MGNCPSSSVTPCTEWKKIENQTLKQQTFRYSLPGTLDREACEKKCNESDICNAYMLLSTNKCILYVDKISDPNIGGKPYTNPWASNTKGDFYECVDRGYQTQ
jgi:hypothetical protein